MSDKQYTISDMIGAAKDESPSDFSSAFNALVLDKIQDVIQAKKIEVAQNYFNYEDESEEVPADEVAATDENEGNTDENTEATAGEENREA